MTITIKGAAELRGQLQIIENFLNDPKPMEGIIEDIKETILEKTEDGHDYVDRNFKPYSKAYARTG